MPDELGPAVGALQKKLDEQLQAVADTKRTINMLLKMSGQKPLYSEADSERSGTIRADQFYGKGLATAAAEYLELRKEACTAEEIMHGLEQGGFDFDLYDWEEGDQLRSFAISLAKNTGTAGKFHRLKNDTIGLRGWYDDEFLKKAAAAAARSTKPNKKKPKPKAEAKPKPKPKPQAVVKTATPSGPKTDKPQEQAKAS
jgi:hypothetical protein